MPQRRPASNSSQTLAVIREEARLCRRCHLWKNATQTVFGEGPASAPVMFVGEQPGDAEDIAGKPFVGPAGQLLRKSLTEAGFDVAKIYLTNAVKHFKWTAKCKRRIHERPRQDEILACRYWLDREIELVKPRAIVALGATAAGVILGSSVRVTRDRAKFFESPLAKLVTLTVHPSSILRSDPEERETARRRFVADLRTIVARVTRSPVE
jgi:uracil-DNA glycosylase